MHAEFWHFSGILMFLVQNIFQLFLIFLDGLHIFIVKINSWVVISISSPMCMNGSDIWLPILIFSNYWRTALSYISFNGIVKYMILQPIEDALSISSIDLYFTQFNCGFVLSWRVSNNFQLSFIAILFCLTYFKVVGQVEVLL